MTDDAQKLITNNTRITIGSAVAVVLVLAGIFFKAGQTLSEFEVLKITVTDIRSDLRVLGEKLDKLGRQ